MARCKFLTDARACEINRSSPVNQPSTNQVPVLPHDIKAQTSRKHADIRERAAIAAMHSVMADDMKTRAALSVPDIRIFRATLAADDEDSAGATDGEIQARHARFIRATPRW